MSIQLPVEPRPSGDVDADRLFEVLETPSARRILATMGGEPMTASELAARSDIAKSTMYRQLDELIDANLVEKSVRIDTGGHHASQFSRAVSDISISLDGEYGVHVTLR